MTIDSIPLDELISLRCADATRAASVDPIGSAGGYACFLLVEWPLPWPRDVSEIEALRPVYDSVAAAGGRMQCVVPAHAGRARVAFYRGSFDREGLAGPFRCVERVTAAEDVVDVAREIVTTIAESDDVPPGDAPGAEVRNDVLICTHGRRDRCCGSMGTALARVLAESADGLGEHVRIGRTSHLGGHRYAPTALVLPQGTSWAFVDEDALRRITTRSGSLDDLLPRYRGFAGHRHNLAQVLERHAFGEVGWAWLDHHRGATVLGDGRIRFTATAPDGRVRAWEGTVTSRRIAVPVCGEPLDAATKTEDELRLVEVHALA